MKLINLNFTKYKSIIDSGNADIKDFTVLVGKNESGKTNILKALYKFNNTVNEQFTKLRDYPRSIYHEYDENHPVVRVIFQLTDEEKKELQEQFEITGVSYIHFTRKYNYTLEIEMSGENKDTFLEVIPGQKLKEVINEFKDTVEELAFPMIPNQTEDQFNVAKKELSDFANKITENIENNDELFNAYQEIDIKSRINSLNNIVNKYSNVGASKQLNSRLDNIKRIQNIIKESIEYILKQIPIFIYFDTYAKLDSRIHLPNFVQRKNTDSMTATDKTANTMFELTKLDIKKLIELGKIVKPDFSGTSEEYKTQLVKYNIENAKKIRDASDERTIIVDRASQSLSTQLREIWKQRENKPSFDLDGDNLRLWVTDDVSNAKIELEERSKGFQWFLSFFIVFMVESDLGHKNAILLLDEPGLNLHASAQTDLISVLHDLSQKNQLIYSTHSPFMIDTEDLSSIHIVTIDQNEGTKISDTTWPTDTDALFPLQSALGYSASQSLFIGKNILIVEGITDYWILSSLSSYLKDTNKTGLDDDLIITPAGGAQKIAYLTSMMVSQKLNVTILTDYDTAGKQLFDELVKTRILKEKHLVFVNEGIQPNQEMAIEDLFPEDYYLKFVNDAYSKELKGQQITSLTSKHPMITKRVEEELEKQNIKFYKTRPTRIMLDEFRSPSSPIPTQVLDNFETLFKIINQRRPK